MVAQIMIGKARKDLHTFSTMSCFDLLQHMGTEISNQNRRPRIRLEPEEKHRLNSQAGT
ncbi:hypothetical protein PGT21_017070 [Puccinia graminis f. sp. tritici]|uniref:Uncharacterized protein n=1 Tax=Puccinia graminis f. sp. tritici TaxID=56615 RepID=A0A5B0M8S7_PUCGR|nr:hypothetical protein PGT21_017070 [Puccinia graminis f. sp. tritici]